MKAKDRAGVAAKPRAEVFSKLSVRRWITTSFLHAVLCIVFALMPKPAAAADYPAPVENDWVVKDFSFHTGEVLPEMRIHYTTIGSPSKQPVLILHGTSGSGSSLLTPTFAGSSSAQASRWIQTNTLSFCLTL